MAGNGNRDKKILAGIELTLHEIHDLRADFNAFMAKAEEDRKKADEDRRKADEDRRRSDERFEFLLTRMDADRERSDHRFKQLLKGVLDVGKGIQKTQERHTALLEGILRAIRAGADGAHGDGHGKKVS